MVLAFLSPAQDGLEAQQHCGYIALQYFKPWRPTLVMLELVGPSAGQSSESFMDVLYKEDNVAGGLSSNRQQHSMTRLSSAAWFLCILCLLSLSGVLT